MNNIGTHNFADVLINSVTSRLLVIFVVTYIITLFIAKKISKKTLKINSIIYLFLLLIYIVFSVIEAFAISKLPPHDLLKDLCGHKYEIIKIISIIHIPLLNTFILLAKLGDTITKEKKSINKQLK